MNLIRTIAVSVIISSFGLVMADAQSLRNASEPSEFPPASYKGKQYVDSRGCAYIRAGIDGAVNWVPRVSRARQHLCGLQPTRVAGASPAPAPAPRSKVVQIELDETPVATPVPKPRAQQPRVVRQAAVQPKASVTPPKQLQPRRRAVQPVQRKTETLTTATRRTSCPNFTGASARYAGRGPGVRCGPQSQGMAVTRQPVQVMRAGKPVTVQQRVVRQVPRPAPQILQPVATPQPRYAAQPQIVKRDPRTGELKAPPGTRLVPRHVYEQQQASKTSGAIPKGYRKVWDDDRLNSKRAHMTAQGIKQSELIWSNTLPRKLNIRDTNRVVNDLDPDLRYPYASMKNQNRAMGFTTSTRSKPKAAAPAPRRAAAPSASGAGRYVQVGTFGNPSNAQRAARRLQAAGLPARIGQYTRGSKRYQVVMAGPFGSNQAHQALSSARRAGFSDAFVK